MLQYTNASKAIIILLLKWIEYLILQLLAGT